MNAKYTNYLIIGAFILATAIGFAAWVAGLTLLWFILNQAGFRTDLWAMIEALSTAVAAAAVFGAGFIAYRELSEAANSRYIDVSDRLFQEMNTRENIEARRWVFQNLPEDPEKGAASLTPEGHAAVKRVLNSLDRVAFLTQSGWIPDDIIMPWMHPMIAKSWDRLEPYVLHERVRRGEPYYYRYAGELAERCRAWRVKHRQEVRVKWVEDAL